MKIVTLLFFVFVGISDLNAQTHHFNDYSTTLIKTTDQSPAHCYIEIFNDVGVDTTLRWKAFFENVPSQWQINFDDQNNNYTNVQDGDSADFILMAAPQFPQKLIIGAILSNTPAEASIYFEIYNPLTPQLIDTIAYHFIVSIGTQDLSDLLLHQLVTLKNGVIRNPSQEKVSLEIYDISGKNVYAEREFEQFDLETLSGGQLFFLSFRKGHDHYLIKIIP